MKFCFRIFFLIIIVLWINPQVSFGSSIFFDPDKVSYKPDEDFVVKIYLNTKGETVNAIDGKIIFPSEILRVKEIREGNSSLNFWIEKPFVKKDGLISYTGMTPGGVIGNNVYLFSIVFSGNDGVGNIISDSTVVLKNDGKGTRLANSEGSMDLSISDKNKSNSADDVVLNDTYSPEDFVPFIANDPLISNGNNFLVFSTQDKGGGIDHYEVKEGWLGDYQKTNSPYVLNDQGLSKTYYVKAIDKNGNERIVKIDGKNKASWYYNYVIGVIIILLIIIFLRKKFGSL